MILERGRELVTERLRRLRRARSVDDHLSAAVRWLYAAQDASADGGVSHSYVIGKGWMRSYPETTGYIIPTLLNWGRLTGSPEAESRALRMADWELCVQLPDGAIPEPLGWRPVVFDTGQVIFGWISAYEVSKRSRYLDAAMRAGEWLLNQLDSDGVWPCASGTGLPRRVYNARVAWSLLELSRISGDKRFVAPMKRFLHWTLGQEKEGGWFHRNCLTDDTAPLLHTIAYTARGQLESGMLLAEPSFLESATRTATSVLQQVRRNGYLPGRFHANWRPAASWACLTGMAQMSIVWRRLATLQLDCVSTTTSQRERFREAAERVNGFLLRTHDCSSYNPGLHGGVRGSYPVNGGYGTWRVLNWATKFFVDAFIMERDLRGRFYY